MEYGSLQTSLTATGTHMPHGITQCYPPLPQPIKAGTWRSNLRGMRGWVYLADWLLSKVVYLLEDGYSSQ